jgi:hypothetical protein
MGKDWTGAQNCREFGHDMKIRPLLPLALVFAAPALAGPWPQPDGQAFVSGTVEHAGGMDWVVTAYGEYGLTPEITLGFDSSTTAFVGEGYVFLRYPVLQGDGPNRFAILGGVGASGNLERGVQPLWVIGASWGRGLTYPFGAGWASVDASMRFRRENSFASERLTKLDATLGWQRENRDLAILQLQTSQERGQDPLIKFAPSYVWHFADLFQVETGLTLPLAGDDVAKVKIGIWSQF